MGVVPCSLIVATVSSSAGVDSGEDGNEDVPTVFATTGRRASVVDAANAFSDDGGSSLGEPQHTFSRSAVVNVGDTTLMVGSDVQVFRQQASEW